MFTVIITPQAQDDIASVLEWYELEAPGIAAQFAGELTTLPGRVAAAPRQFPVIRKSARRALLDRFPYFVVLRIVDMEVHILACLHNRRDPRHWQRRG
ncbi:MAG: type II toxin-antitoxin system RelE/ParE family toxin [Azospirillaceae bacterium]|nr:type II toxin-antitoxin system RelE/ParE family toxin [Azospirillaceae bacterium]